MKEKLLLGIELVAFVGFLAMSVVIISSMTKVLAADEPVPLSTSPLFIYLLALILALFIAVKLYKKRRSI